MTDVAPTSAGAFGVPAGMNTLFALPGTVAGLQFPAVVHDVPVAPVQMASAPTGIDSALNSTRAVAQLGRHAFTVSAPGAPSVSVKLAWPPVFVVTACDAGDPPPAIAVKPMFTPATGLFSASRASTTITEASGFPVTPVCASPAIFTSCVAAPATVVAMNNTGLPASTVAVAVSVSLCTALPSVQLVGLASPLALVVAAPPTTTPLAAFGTANVTFTPATWLSEESLTITVGFAVATVATTPLSAVAVDAVRVTAGPAMRVIAFDVALV